MSKAAKRANVRRREKRLSHRLCTDAVNKGAIFEQFYKCCGKLLQINSHIDFLEELSNDGLIWHQENAMLYLSRDVFSRISTTYGKGIFSLMFKFDPVAPILLTTKPHYVPTL